MKPIVELFTELQSAVDKADADKAALQTAKQAVTADLEKAEKAYQTALAKAQADAEKAKTVYEAAKVKAQTAVQSLEAASDDSSAYIRTLRDELNNVLGRFDSRVRVG